MKTSKTNLSLAVIDEIASDYSKARSELVAAVADLQDEMAKLQRARISKIKRLAADAATVGDELRRQVEISKDLFVKPRTFTLHGIKIGFKKGSGKVTWDDPDKVVARIKKHFPDLVDQLVITKEKPSADGLRSLDTKDLAKVGAAVEGTGDVVLVQAADSEVDKIVSKMLSEGETEVEA